MYIDFISNLDLNDTSGGWNGINYKMFNSLTKITPVLYVGPINPPVIYSEKIVSKLFRVCNLRGKYFFFSKRRLRRISDKILKNKLNGDIVFYFGATPWVEHDITKPYAIYLDICFPRYLELFLQGQKFSRSDTKRIAELESNFLSNAKCIFWGSTWAYKEACNIYKKDFKQSTIISTGGNIPIPDKLNEKYEKKLLFISLNFQKKGGWLAYETFKVLKKTIPELRLSIIGERPPDIILEECGVNYVGLLKKENEADLKILISEISTSFFLIHPTIMDTMGAVIAEAGYYGVPTIAPDNFGIPDLITNGKTGVLIDLPLTVEKFSVSLKLYFDDSERYIKMRQEVYLFMKQNRSWEAIAKKILTTILN